MGLTEDSIVLSACLFGSVYLFGTALNGINKKWINRPPSNINILLESTTFFDILNGSILIVSGSIITASACKAIKLLNK